MDVGLLDHRRQRLLGHPPRLEEAGEVRAPPQLRDAQLHRSGPRLPVPVAVAVALDQPLRALLAPGRAGQAAHLQLHQPLGGEADHLAQQIGVGGLLDQAAQGHHLVGHRGSPVQVGVSQPDPTEEPAMTTAPPPARQRFNPRRRAAALPSSYTTTWDTTTSATQCTH